MKAMKKFLSLVLALMLVLSSMAVLADGDIAEQNVEQSDSSVQEPTEDNAAAETENTDEESATQEDSSEAGVEAYSFEDGPAHGPHDGTHEYEERRTDKDVKASCTKTGEEWYHCNICDKDYFIETPMIPHANGNAAEVTKDPTCTEDGEKTYAPCSVCNKVVVEEIPATGHKVADDGWKEEKPANCTENQVVAGTCIVCNEKVTKEEPNTKKGHTWEAPDYAGDPHLHVQKAPTCNEQGTVGWADICDRCGAASDDVKDVSYVPAIQHNIEKFATDSYVQILDGENAVGEKIKVLNVNTAGLEELAGDKIVEKDGVITYTLPERFVEFDIDGDGVMDGEGAKIGSVIVTYKPATCTEGGSINFKCQLCNDEYEAKADPLGHDYQMVFDEDGNPVDGVNHLPYTQQIDCTTENNILFQCTRCENTINQNFPACDDHVFRTSDESTIVGYAQQLFSDSKLVYFGAGEFDKIQQCHDYYVYYNCTNLGGMCEKVHPVKVEGKNELHVAKTYTIKTDATCTEPSTEAFNCTKCGFPVITHKDPAHGHSVTKDFVEWVTEPTCTEAGERIVKCTYCGEKFNEAVPALGHHYVVVEDKDSDCIKGIVGYTLERCSICKDEKKTMKDPGHVQPALTEFEAFTAPTCEKDGSGSFWCTKCHTLQHVTFAKLNHKNEDGTSAVTKTKVSDPSCATGKEHGTIWENVCSICGKKWQTEDEDVPTAHTMYETTGEGEQLVNSFYIEVLPTCTAVGKAHFRCAVCKEEHVIDLPMLPHNEVLHLNEKTHQWELICSKLDSTETSRLNELIAAAYPASEHMELVGKAVYEQMVNTRDDVFFGFEDGVVVRTFEVVKPHYTFSAKSIEDGFIEVSFKNIVDGASELKDCWLRVSFTYDLSDGTSYSYRPYPMHLTASDYDEESKTWKTGIGISDHPEGSTFTGISVIICSNASTARSSTVKAANADKYGSDIIFP